ncbi:hypothetical protein M0M57_15330 [Flavobacterium azooxidireducens]|uniref:DUF2231 domain-containing protein n=1 Tax=Flavobacterium azooxidireducens TaxID=1871076 RepID=A0ABY4KDT7_9FLAO|nr:hypothetical protein [Flavobacterium azooxidireducens]UPQ78978.1 hypothetical protein M0M57_15330 [Flavobacterium azooxidireducens]
MNDAHLHMVFNHFPIIGLFFGIGILAYGIFKKQTILVNIAYVIFIFCMIMAKATMMTGEGAEEIVEELGISHDIIHEHEEVAETFMKVLYGLGILSVLGLVANFKKHSRAAIVSYVVLISAIGTAVFSKSVGTSGGEIRHTEIRENSTFQNNVISVENESKTDDD